MGIEESLLQYQVGEVIEHAYGPRPDGVIRLINNTDVPAHHNKWIDVTVIEKVHSNLYLEIKANAEFPEIANCHSNYPYKIAHQLYEKKSTSLGWKLEPWRLCSRHKFQPNQLVYILRNRDSYGSLFGGYTDKVEGRIQGIDEYHVTIQVYSNQFGETNKGILLERSPETRTIVLSKHDKSLIRREPRQKRNCC